MAGAGAAAGIHRAAVPGPQVVLGSTGEASSFEDDINDVVLTAATRFVARAIGRRVKRAYDERVVPAMAAKQAAMLREQIAIAERHPDLRAA